MRHIFLKNRENKYKNKNYSRREEKLLGRYWAGI
jgi:hypothetical protein